jgi:hypothetical protein
MLGTSCRCRCQCCAAPLQICIESCIIWWLSTLVVGRKLGSPAAAKRGSPRPSQQGHPGPAAFDEAAAQQLGLGKWEGGETSSACGVPNGGNDVGGDVAAATAPSSAAAQQQRQQQQQQQLEMLQYNQQSPSSPTEVMRAASPRLGCVQKAPLRQLSRSLSAGLVEVVEVPERTDV